ncbi:hypothetical protein ACFWA1_36730, partial [Streptomyces sp. NPDC060005]|uniref:hypothetical protein n=1 Tax=Streptomyces sp. NPDC060005 TaxID=3347034 RepID=UPI0036C6A07E
YIRPSPLDQTWVERLELLDPGVSDGHLMYRHGPSRRMPGAGSTWLRRILKRSGNSAPPALGIFSPSGD